MDDSTDLRILLMYFYSGTHTQFNKFMKMTHFKTDNGNIKLNFSDGSISVLLQKLLSSIILTEHNWRLLSQSHFSKDLANQFHRNITMQHPSIAETSLYLPDNCIRTVRQCRSSKCNQNIG